MDLTQISLGIEIVATILAIVCSLIAGLWAYLVFIVGRGLLPAVQFDIEFNSLGKKNDQRLFQISYIVQNKGHYPLVVSDLKTKIRYIESDDKLTTENNENKATYCRLIFPRSLGKLIKTGDPLSPKKIISSLKLVDYDTFVQPGLDQIYNFTIALPEKTEYVLIKGFFNYNIKELTWFSQILLGIGVKIKVIPFLFQHINKPHTVEKTFSIKNA